MPIFEFSRNEISSLNKTTFSQLNLNERSDLQRLLREKIDVIAPDTLVIAEEFAEWDKSRIRIDLLGIDRNANLVVIELKRTEDGGYMDLQAIRYAALVSTMTFDQAVDIFNRYLGNDTENEADARTRLLDFLGRELDEDTFAQDVRIVLASADFSAELTTSVLWLNDRDMDIRCVRLQPYEIDGRVLVDVQQIIPLPEAEDYQVRVRGKKRRERIERETRYGNTDRTRYDLAVGDRDFHDMPKGRAILKIFRCLVESGIEPDDLGQVCGRGGTRLFMGVKGEVTSDEFIRRANTIRKSDGRTFDTRRFFCGDEDLVIHSGRTYAFSNQWGGADWEAAMNALRDTFPDQNIAFSPVK